MKLGNSMVFIILFSSCGFLNSRKEPPKSYTERFYETYAGWDIKHIPVIPPIRATSTYPDEWLVQSRKNGFDNFSVLEFGVSQCYMYGSVRKGYTNEPESWFLLHVRKEEMTRFQSEEELNTKMLELALRKNPMSSGNEYFDRLVKGKKLYWFPNHGGETDSTNLCPSIH